MLLQPMLARLHDARDLPDVLATALRDVLALMGAEMGCLQLVGRNDELVIVAQSGLTHAFLEYFRRLPAGCGTVCGRAAELTQPLVVSDVRRDADFTPYVDFALSVPFRAVVSAPLCTSAKERIGVVSVHFANPVSPTRLEIDSLASYSAPVADAIVRLAGGRPLAALAEDLAQDLLAAVA